MFKFLKKKDGADTFYSFGSGKILALDKVPDQVFAEKMMGDGFALDITDGNIYAPVDGEVTLVFPTGHAFGLTTASGVEVLIHIGIDTVELDGEGFTGKVKQGDSVKAGDLLTVVDLDFIKSKGKPTITPLIFTSGNKIELLRENEDVTKDSTDIFKFTE